MSQQAGTKKWHWISMGSGLISIVLMLLLLYAPNGIWKPAATVFLVVTFAVLILNPYYRLFRLGTAAALTGLAGFFIDFSFGISIELSNHNSISGDVSRGTGVHPIYFILLFAIGILVVAFHSVGKGWTWPTLARKNAVKPNLTFSLESKIIELEGDEDGQFRISMSILKDVEASVKLVRVEIKNATIVAFGVSAEGDGLYNTTIQKNKVSEFSVVGTFPKSKLKKGSTTRKIVIVDQFNQEWVAGKVEFRTLASF